MPIHLSTDTLQTAISKQKEGQRLEDIAAELGVSKKALSRAMRTTGYIPSVPSPVMARLTKDKDAIIAAYTAGQTQTELTRQYVCDWFSLRKFLIKNGVEIRKEWVRNTSQMYSLEVTPEFLKTITAEYEAGANIVTIAATHKRSNAYIRKLLKREGVKLRQSGPVKSEADRALASNLKLYGVSVEQFNLINSLQDSKCAICGTDAISVRNGRGERLCVDHSHSTGDVRGLLCSQCNMAIGNFADNVGWLEKAAKYLQQPPVFKSAELTTVVNTKYMAISTSVEDQIIHLLKQDMRYVDIANTVNVSPPTVRAVAKRAKLHKPRAIMSLETKQAMGVDKQAGVPVSEIAKKYKVTVGSVYKAMADLGQ